MNGRFYLHMIAHPHSEVYYRYFRRLVFGNSLTFSHIPPCFHAKPPDFPRLFGPREIEIVMITFAKRGYYNAGVCVSVGLSVCVYICVSAALYHTITLLTLCGPIITNCIWRKPGMISALSRNIGQGQEKHENHCLSHNF